MTTSTNQECTNHRMVRTGEFSTIYDKNGKRMVNVYKTKCRNCGTEGSEEE